jgi:hypothetical protein
MVRAGCPRRIEAFVRTDQPATRHREVSLTVSIMDRPADTSRDASDRQLAALRSMTPAARLRLADDMSQAVRGLVEAGIRRRQPDLSDADRAAALAGIVLGRELAGTASRRKPVRVR